MEGVPDTTRLDDVGRALKLDDKGYRHLTAVIVRIGETIAGHKAATESRIPRTDRNKALRSIASSLANIEDKVDVLSGQDASTLSRIFAATLAELLSNAGVEAGLGQPISWSTPSFRLLESRDATSREGPYNVLESEHYRPEREAILRTHTSTVLHGHFRQLKQQLDAFLAVDLEHNKGGSEGRPYRNYAVAVLAETFQPIFGEAPKSSPGGTFCQLCEYALPELGEDTDGLDTAILRILRALRH